MAENKVPKISIGITSLTVILCVLCLTVFSVLSLSTAVSEKKLAEKRAAAAEAYYKAENFAAEMTNGLMTAQDAVQYAAENHIRFSSEGEKQIFDFVWPIDEGQELSVELVHENEWEVTRWQVVSTGDWTPDESLDVWDGEMFFTE